MYNFTLHYYHNISYAWQVSVFVLIFQRPRGMETFYSYWVSILWCDVLFCNDSLETLCIKIWRSAHKRHILQTCNIVCRPCVFEWAPQSSYNPPRQQHKHHWAYDYLANSMNIHTQPTDCEAEIAAGAWGLGPRETACWKSRYSSDWGGGLYSQAPQLLPGHDWTGQLKKTGGTRKTRVGHFWWLNKNNDGKFIPRTKLLCTSNLLYDDTINSIL